MKKKFDKMTGPDIAEAFGVDVRTVYRWVDAGCPRGKSKRFILSDVIAWRVEQLTDTAEVGPDSEALEEFRRTKTELLKLDLAVKRGDLAPRSEVDAELFEKGRKIRDSILGVPHRLAAELAAESSAHVIGQRLHTELTNCLWELSGAEPERHPPGWKPHHERTRYKMYLKAKAAGESLKMYQDFVDEEEE